MLRLTTLTHQPASLIGKALLRRIAATLSLGMLLLVVAGVASAQTSFPGDDPATLAAVARRVKTATDDLLANPNVPSKHLALAEALLQRGALDDARRVRRHIERALALDSDLEDEAAAMMRRAPVTARSIPLDGEELALDRRAAATIPAGAAQGSQWDEAISTGLADRVLRRDFRVDKTSFKEVRADLCRVFGWNDGEREDREVWPERLEALSRRSPLTGWQGNFEQAVFSAVSQFNAGSALRGSWNGRGGTSAAAATADDEDRPPDPLESRAKAVAAWNAKEPVKAVNHFLDAVAATEVEKAKSDEEAPVLAQAASAPSAPLPAPAPTTNQAPEGTTENGEGAPPSPADGESAGQDGARPEVNGEIGQTGMETLEAMSNPEVPTQKVSEKVQEAAMVGVVGEPLLLDLDGDGRPGVAGGLLPDGRLQGRTVRFDLDGDGHAERCEWIDGKGDGLLAVDLDGDGVISSGRELFGNAHGDRDGFRRLGRYDVDGDGWIRGLEARGLRVWQDDGDGVCEEEELKDLASWGITAISCRPDGPVAAVTGPGPVRHVWEWLPDIRSR